jgi:hypothetical protein
VQRGVLFFRIGTTFPCANQTSQTIVDIGAPCVGTDIEAFVFEDQAEVAEVDFRRVAVPGDLESDLRVLPLAFVFGEVKVVVPDESDYLFVGNAFD